MKIYFTASARGMKKYRSNYQFIYQTIEKMGHTNIDDLLFTYEKKYSIQQDYNADSRLSDYAYKKIRVADVVVLEVSEPSLSLGYVVHSALEMNKPVILLHIRDSVPIFFSQIQHEHLQVAEYNLRELSLILSTCIKCASNQKLIRFNFFITSEQDHYLLKMSRKLRKPKSTLLREMIDAQLCKLL